ncbi:MAG: protein kinase domain-containing protein [Oceanococcus sp.]
MVSTSDQGHRQLAAVVFLDMVGYSALMQENETRAQAAVDVVWDIARPLVAQHGGTEVRLFGDGMLLTFGGTVAAAQCLLQVFQELAQHNQALATDQRIGARAGIHLGDISSRDGEIFGDGVNIASRLVGLAPPGGIALSPHVRDQLTNTLDHPLKSLGIKALKNIKAPMELFCLPGPECSAADLHAAVIGGDAPARLWRFGAAEFDERALELTVAGQAVALERSAVEVLLGLLSHAGEVVTSEELREAADGISEAQLSQCISQLRSALRDEQQQQIKTQAGFGYRLAVLVSVEAAPNQTLTQFDYKPGDHPPLRPLWSLEKLLGAGGHGEVWLARHDKTHEERVYKFALDASKLSSLKREITLSRVLHSTAHNAHFIRVLDWNLELSPYFIECEYGGNDNLLGWAQAQGGIDQVPMALRLELAVQIAEALAAAHSVGVLHKDLKPGNILIHQVNDETPRVKLADFGSGEVLDPQHMADAGITRMGFTQAVVIDANSSAGTPLYFAPELFSGQPATVQADVYALGVLLYQLLVGNFRKPLSTGWEGDIADELLREDIAAATHGDPQLRLADAAGFAQRLRQLEARREQREAEVAAAAIAQQHQRDAEQAKQRLALMQSRRRWTLTVILALVIGLAAALRSQQAAVVAREQATAAAAQSQAVADFLSKDLFSVVGEKPLRDLTVQELLQSAADKLDQRDEQLPEVAAQLHAAIGDAFLKMTDYSEAGRHFDQALQHYLDDSALDSATALRAAQMSVDLLKYNPPELNRQLPRLLAIRDSFAAELDPLHPSLLDFAWNLAQAQYAAGNWADSLREMQDLIARAQRQPEQHQDWILSSRLRLVDLYRWVGEFAKARALLAKLDKQLAQHPEVPPMQMANRHAFAAHLLVENERFAEARETVARARALIEPWLPAQKNHVSLQLDLLDGQIAQRAGLHEAALVHLKPAVETMVALEWIQQVNMGGPILHMLASAHADAGQTEEAIALWREALEWERRGQRLDGNDTVMIRIGLAEQLGKSGQLEAARTQLEQIDEQALARIGEGALLWAQLRRVQGLQALLEHKSELARERLQEARRRYLLHYGEQHSFSRRAAAELKQATGT